MASTSSITSLQRMKLCFTISSPQTKKKVTMEWKYSGSPTTKKFNVTTAAETIFSDSLCVFLVDNLERSQTLNADRYCDTLTRLRKSSDANGGAG
ncbi:hypothetical protein TNCV_3231231 [Trichonephila clavipes]|nr:hypothetical protein TNCV_3231231 [Trichonephila clavipes]